MNCGSYLQPALGDDPNCPLGRYDTRFVILCGQPWNRGWDLRESDTDPYPLLLSALPALSVSVLGVGYSFFSIPSAMRFNNSLWIGFLQDFLVVNEMIIDFIPRGGVYSGFGRYLSDLVTIIL